MSYKVLIASDVKRQIIDILTFTNHVSHEYALKVRDTINSAIDSLKEMPKRFPIIIGIESMYGEVRKCVLKDKRFILIFSVNDDKVIVDALIDVRKEDFSKLFK